MSEELLGDVVALLLRKRDYHKQQLKKIEKMLAVASSDAPVETETTTKVDQNKFAPKTNISWSKHIREIFSDKNVALNVKQLADEIVSRGITDKKIANEAGNTIAATVFRLAKQGDLIRSEDGIFSRGPKHPQSEADKSLSDLIG